MAKVARTTIIFTRVNPVNFSSVLRACFINKIGVLKDRFLGYDLIIIAAINGSKNTTELIFTPKAKPKAIEARIRYKALLCFRNFSIKSKDPNKKKVNVDSGVAK